MSTRGIKNCNPGNIRHSKDKWQGMRAEQTDKSFVQFVSMEYGYRALFKMLRAYKNKWHCNTIKEMLYRWCPNGDGDNDSSLYVKIVCNDLQVPSSYVVDVYDRDVMCALANAMTYVENGIKVDDEILHRAWEMCN